jgi:hypothetical protein
MNRQPRLTLAKVGPSGLTMEQPILLFRKLTGREPTVDEVEAVSGSTKCFTQLSTMFLDQARLSEGGSTPKTSTWVEAISPPETPNELG